MRHNLSTLTFWENVSVNLTRVFVKKISVYWSQFGLYLKIRCVTMPPNLFQRKLPLNYLNMEAAANENVWNGTVKKLKNNEEFNWWFLICLSFVWQILKVYNFKILFFAINLKIFSLPVKNFNNSIKKYLNIHFSINLNMRGLFNLRILS